jgi:hypothetical protein
MQQIKRTFYEFPASSLYSLFSKAAAKESMSTNVLGELRIKGAGVRSPITR